MRGAFPPVMALGPPEIRKDIVPAPPGIAHLAPAIVIPCLPAHVDHAVDRGTAAQHPAPRIVQRPPVQAGLRLGLQAPVKPRVPHGVKIPDRHVNPEMVVASPGFQQQHAALRIARQPVRKHAARRPGPDDDEVETPLVARPLSSARCHGAATRTACSWCPSPATSSRITSPSFSQTCGRIPSPTPGGVPVVTTSPGSSVMNWLR